MTTRSRLQPLAGLEPPTPRPELRGRTLAAARAARRAQAPDVWSRLWASRSLRLAWGAIVAGLLVAHVAVSLRPHPAVLHAKEPLLMATTISDPELKAFLELDPISFDSLPLLGDAGRAVTVESRHERKENNAG